MAKLELILDGKKVQIGAKEFEEAVARVKRAAGETTDTVGKLQNVLGKLGLAFSAIATVKGAISTIVDFELNLVKTGNALNLTGPRLQAFGRELVTLSTKIPVATAQLLDIASAARSLGLQTNQQVVKFTETMARMGVVSDLSGSQGAAALTKLLAVTGSGAEDLERLASALLSVRDISVAGESEIAELATKIGLVTAGSKISAAELVGMAGAVSVLGARSLTASEAFGDLFTGLEKIFKEGGDGLRRFSEISGKSASDLENLWGTSQVQTMIVFLQALNRIINSGGDFVATMKALGLEGSTNLKIFPALSKNADLVAESVGRANEEFKENKTLQAESSAVFETTIGEWDRLWNNIKAAALALRDFNGLTATTLKGINDSAGALREYSQVYRGVIEDNAKIQRDYLAGRPITESNFGLKERNATFNLVEPPPAATAPVGGAAGAPRGSLYRLSPPPRGYIDQRAATRGELQRGAAAAGAAGVPGYGAVAPAAVEPGSAYRADEVTGGIEGMASRYKAAIDEAKKAEDASREMERLAENTLRVDQAAAHMGYTFENTFDDLAQNFDDLEGVLERFLKNVSAAVFNELVSKQIGQQVYNLVNQIGSSLFPTLSKGAVPATATATAPQTATYYGTPGGQQHGGMVRMPGETTPEYILPVGRDASGRMGVRVVGGGRGGSVTVVQNIRTPDVGGFRRSKRMLAREALREFRRAAGA